MSDRPKSSTSKTKSRSKKRKDLKDKRDGIPKDDHSNSDKRGREKARLKEKRRNERKKDSQSPRSPRTGSKHREDVIRSDCKEVGRRVSNSKHEKGKYKVVEAPSQEGNKMRVKASKKNQEKKRQLDSDTNYEKGKNDCRHLDPQSSLVSKSHDKTKENSAIPKCSLDVNVLSQLKSSGGGGDVKTETSNLKKVEKKENKASSNCRNREEEKRLKRDNKTKKREDKKTISSPFDRKSKESRKGRKGRKDETLPTNGEKHDKRRKKDHIEKENQALKRDRHEDRLQEKDIPKHQGGSQTQMPNCSLDTNVLSQIKHNGGKAKESVSKKKSKASTNKKKPVKSVSQEKSKEATSKKKSKEAASGKKSKEPESKKRAKLSRDKQNESAFKIRNIWLCVFARKTKKDKAKSNKSTETKKHIDKTEPNSISSKDKPSKRKIDKRPAKGDDGIHRDGKRRKPVKTDKMSKSMEEVKKSSSMNSRRNKKDPKKEGASSSKKNASLSQYKNGRTWGARPPPPPPPPKRQINNTRKHDQDHVQGEKKSALPRNDEVRKRRVENTSDSSNKQDMIIPSSSLSSAVLGGIKGVDKSKLSKVQPNSQSNPKTTPVKKSSLAHSVLSDISSGVANLKHPSSVENTKNQEPFNLLSQIKAGKQLKEVSQEEIKQKKKQSDKPISILSQIKQGKQLKHVSQRNIINDGSDEEEYDESKPFGGILARRKMIQESRQDSMYSGYDSEDWE